MRHSEQDDPNLSEVKAVLERLQRISRGRPPRGPHVSDTDNGASPHAPRAAEQPVVEVESGFTAPYDVAASDRPVSNPIRRRVGAVTAVAALLIGLVGAYVFFELTRHTDSDVEPSPVAAPNNSIAARSGDAGAQPVDPSATAARPLVSVPPNVQAALQTASGFMTAGRIQAARAELLRVAQEGSADVAWALARSYDPNFVATIPVADAGPNVAEATRWYRTWYDIAVKQGLVAESVSLERIIGAMH